jgi:hypothetical protein
MASLENESEGEIKFGALLEQIEKCVNQELYYVAIMAFFLYPTLLGAKTQIMERELPTGIKIGLISMLPQNTKALAKTA